MIDRVATSRARVREASEADAEGLLRLQHALDSETSMMMLEVGERRAGVQDVRAHLEAIVASGNSAVFLAEVEGELAGYVEAEGGRYRRTRHSAHVVIGIRGAWQGQGLGRTLLTELEVWARRAGIRRLELTVRADNQRARQLYESAGYVHEGVRHGSLLVDGELVDEIAMARLL